MAELKDALEKAKTLDRTTVIVVETDPSVGVPGYESWWDVAVAEVSEMDERTGGAGPVRNARANANAIISEAEERTTMIETLPNFIDGAWRTSDAAADAKRAQSGLGTSPGASASLAGRGGASGRGDRGARVFRPGGAHPRESASSRYSS